MGYVNKSGNVNTVEVAESTGTSRMNASALNAFSSYRFQKGQEGWVKMPFEFTLEGEAKVISVRDRELLNSIQ